MPTSNIKIAEEEKSIEKKTWSSKEVEQLVFCIKAQADILFKNSSDSDLIKAKIDRCYVIAKEK